MHGQSLGLIARSFFQTCLRAIRHASRKSSIAHIYVVAHYIARAMAAGLAQEFHSPWRGRSSSTPRGRYTPKAHTRAARCGWRHMLRRVAQADSEATIATAAFKLRRRTRAAAERRRADSRLDQFPRATREAIENISGM